MESDKLNELLFPQKIKRANLLLDTAAFHQVKRNRELLNELVLISLRLSFTHGYADGVKIDNYLDLSPDDFGRLKTLAEGQLDLDKGHPAPWVGFAPGRGAGSLRTDATMNKKFLMDKGKGQHALKELESYPQVNSLESKVSELFLRVRESATSSKVEGLYSEILELEGDKDLELMALSDYLMMVNYIKGEQGSEAKHHYENIPKSSVNEGIRLLRAAAASTLIGHYLSQMELANASEIFFKMDSELNRKSGERPKLSLVGRQTDPESFCEFPLRPRVEAPRLTLLNSQKVDRAKQLGSSILRLLDLKDPEEIRMRVAKNLILFSAHQNEPGTMLQIWQSLYREPWFPNSLEEHAFHKVMAYAAALSGEERKAFFHLKLYQKQADLPSFKEVRARVLLALIYSYHLSCQGDRLYLAAEELFSMGDPDKILEGILDRGRTLLARYHSERGDYSEMKEIFGEIGISNYSKPMINEGFKAAAEMIVAHASKGELSVALVIFQILERLDGLEDYNLERIVSALSIVEAFLDCGKLREAKELYFYQGALSLPALPYGLVDGLRLCYSQMDLEGTMESDLFRLEGGKVHSDHLLLERARVAVKLMEALGARGEIKSVFRVFYASASICHKKIQGYLRLGLMIGLFGPSVDTIRQAPMDLSKISEGFFERVLDNNNPKASASWAISKTKEICALAYKGYLNDALHEYSHPSFQTLRTNSPSIKIQAAVAIGFALIKHGDFIGLMEQEETKTLIKSLAEASGPEAQDAASVLQALIAHLCEHGRTKSALELFLGFPSKDQCPKLALTQSLVAIIIAKASLKDCDRETLKRVEEYFASLSVSELRALKAYGLKAIARKSSLV
ncbi:MAG: hypothetical protein LBE27_07820, partial [Deltaproteobacteria bacterium]|nr:hypothetical protein [Deltaproteobacteria bacterium]